jgi:multiple sugar transport system substrate-binding protein
MDFANLFRRIDMKRNCVQVLFLVFLVLITMIACNARNAAKSSNTGGPITLLIWGGVPAENGPQAVVDAYNELNKDRNVKIEYYRYVNDDNGNIALDTALMAGEKMDMFISYTHARRNSRALSGRVMDITEICKNLDIELIRDFGTLAQGNIIDGKIYSIPTMKFMNVMIFNKKILDEAGIPVPTIETTWDDMRTIAQKLTRNNTYGFFLNPQDDFYSHHFYSTKQEYAVPYMNADGKSSAWASNPDFRAAFRRIYDMMYTDKSIMDWGTMIAENVTEGNKQDIMFFNGQIAATGSGTHVIRNLINTEVYPHNFVTAFAPIPRASSDQEKYYASVEANDHISININCEYPEEAVRYIKWYYTEGYDPMIKNGRLPLYRNYDADRAFSIMIGDHADLIDAESFKNTVFGNYEYFNLPDPDRNRAVIARIVREEVESYFLNQTNLDQLINNLETRTNEALQ